MKPVSIAYYAQCLAAKGVKAFLKESRPLTGDAFVSVKEVQYRNGVGIATIDGKTTSVAVNIYDDQEPRLLVEDEFAKPVADIDRLFLPVLNWQVEDSIKEYLEYKIEDADGDAIHNFRLGQDFSTSGMLTQIINDLSKLYEQSPNSDKMMLIIVILEMLKAAERSDFVAVMEAHDCVVDTMGDIEKKLKQ